MIARRGEDLALRRKPMLVRLAVCLPIGVPDLVGALANAVFQRLLHSVHLLFVEDAFLQCQAVVNERLSGLR